MPTERALAYWQRAQWVEGLILLLAAPVLLFPERFIILTAITLILLALLWLAPLFLARSPLIPATPYNATLFVFCLTVSVAILVTADPQLTLSKAAGVILGFAVWRYLILAIRRREHLTWAVTGYILAGLVFVALGLLNADWLLKTTSQVPVVGRLLPQQFAPVTLLQGIEGIHPNQIAGTITLILPLLVALWVGSGNLDGSRQRFIRWAIVLATTFCSIALLLTQSRSGWVGVFGGLLLLLVLWSIVMEPSRYRRMVRICAGILLALTLGIFLAVGPQGVQQAWLDPPQETAVGSLATFNFRRQLWPWAVRAIGDFPLTGTGLGTFRRVAGRLYPVPIEPDVDFAHAHNVFLQVALDLGIPGLIAYLALLLVSIKTAWQLAKRDRLLRPVAAGILASLIAFHIYGLADTLALGSKSAVLLWALFGLLGAMLHLRQITLLANA